MEAVETGTIARLHDDSGINFLDYSGAGDLGARPDSRAVIDRRLELCTYQAVSCMDAPDVAREKLT